YLKNALRLLLSPIVPTIALILQSNLPDSPLNRLEGEDEKCPESTWWIRGIQDSKENCDQGAV
ncbi:MAG: hypothetical protein ACPG1Z_12140, partial [Planctomycetota bacterium]